jgi:hypothetical protein
MISNTHLPTLEYIADGLGFGGITCNRRVAPQNDCYLLFINQALLILEVLDRVEPYLVTKKYVASLVRQLANKVIAKDYDRSELVVLIRSTHGHNRTRSK